MILSPFDLFLLVVLVLSFTGLIYHLWLLPEEHHAPAPAAGAAAAPAGAHPRHANVWGRTCLVAYSVALVLLTVYHGEDIKKMVTGATPGIHFGGAATTSTPKLSPVGAPVATFHTTSGQLDVDDLPPSGYVLCVRYAHASVKDPLRLSNGKLYGATKSVKLPKDATGVEVQYIMPDATLATEFVGTTVVP